MSLSVTVEYGTWDLDPHAGTADGCFDAEVIGTTADGHWIVRFQRPVLFGGGEKQHWYAVLTPRSVDQPVISEAGPFPYVSATVFLTEAQVDGDIENIALQDMPGLGGTVFLNVPPRRLDNIDQNESMRRAQANVARFVRTDVTLPQNIFAEEWPAYLFLESDRMFSKEAAEALKELLRLEGAHVAFLKNIDPWNDTGLFVDADSSSFEFQKMARQLGFGYVERERFACTSDVGSWCFYCENLGDVGVMALQSADDVIRFRSPLAQLWAKPLQVISNKAHPDSVSPFTNLLPAWRDGLAKNFPSKR
jgi:hypothetical protein